MVLPRARAGVTCRDGGKGAAWVTFAEGPQHRGSDSPGSEPSGPRSPSPSRALSRLALSASSFESPLYAPPAPWAEPSHLACTPTESPVTWKCTGVIELQRLGGLKW